MQVIYYPEAHNRNENQKPTSALQFPRVVTVPTKIPTKSSPETAAIDIRDELSRRS